MENTLVRTLARQESGLEMLQTLLTYVAEASTVVTEAELYQGVMAAVTPERSDLMEKSLAQKWIEQGIEQGKRVAQRQTLLRLLKWRFGLTAEVLTEYSLKFAKIQQSDALARLLDQLLISATVAEFEETLLAYLPKPEKQP